MKNFKRILALALVAAFLPLAALANKNIREISTFSESMQKQIPATVILPDSYGKKKSKKYPVVYLLHGYGGNFKDWSTIKKDLQERASQANVIIVCPDGQNSWYWDSPIDPSFKFETYVSKELVEHIDENFRTVKDKKGRAITGLSMGGHGAMWLAIRHNDVFGAGGSMSGGLDIRPFPNEWNMKDRLGEYEKNKELWDKHTVINEIEKLHPEDLAIIIDCGYDDFFYKVNLDTHAKLLEMKIPHDFIIRPGGHDWNYWNNAVDFQLLFFKKFFDRN